MGNSIIYQNLYFNQIYVLLEENFGVSEEDFIRMLHHSFELSRMIKSDFRTEPFVIKNQKGSVKFYCLFNGVYIAFYLNDEGEYKSFKTLKLTKDYYDTLVMNS